jgi:hypothetical protein
MGQEKHSKSEVLEITAIFKRERDDFIFKLQKAMEDIEKLENELSQLREEKERCSALRRTVSDEFMAGAGMSLSLAGVTIRTEDERLDARKKLLLTSTASKDTLNALQERMRSYLESM